MNGFPRWFAATLLAVSLWGGAGSSVVEDVASAARAVPSSAVARSGPDDSSRSGAGSASPAARELGPGDPNRPSSRTPASLPEGRAGEGEAIDGVLDGPVSHDTDPRVHSEVPPAHRHETHPDPTTTVGVLGALQRSLFARSGRLSSGSRAPPPLS